MGKLNVSEKEILRLLRSYYLYLSHNLSRPFPCILLEIRTQSLRFLWYLAIQMIIFVCASCNQLAFSKGNYISI